MRLKRAFSGLPPYWRLIDQPLFVQFLAAGGIVAIASMISLAIVLNQVKNQTEAFRSLGITHSSIRRLDNLLSSFYKQRVTIFDFMGTSDPVYLDKILANKKAWKENFQLVQSLLRDSPKQTEFLKNLNRDYQAWLILVERFVENPRLVSSADLREESARLKDALLSIDRMIVSQERLATIHSEREQYQTGTTSIAIAVINVMLLFVFGIVLSKLYFSIARPLSDVLNAMMKYQQGDFSVRVPVTNRGTIGFIEASFDEMAEKIEQMVADLRKLDELKSEFISTVSHELRTPLTSIGGYAKLLIAGDAGPLTDIQKEFLNIIDTNVVRLTALINEILDMEALEAGKVELIREPQDLVSVLKECVDTFRIVAQQKGLEVRYEVPKSLSPVLGERSRLVQIFMNLISNAIKYTNSGFIEIRAEQSDFAVKVQVIDSGVGLTKEDQEKLFQKFYRARSSLTSSEGGTGLGLVIVRKLVEALGGSISFESGLKNGTQFNVTFPVMTASGVTEIASKTMSSTVIQPRRVWIIDPNEDDVAHMSSLLKTHPILNKEYQIEVSVFKNLKEIPELNFSKGLPSAIILDPKTNPEGFALTSEIRKKLRRQVPVLVVSSSIDTSLALAEGASAILTKPIQEEEFLIAIRDMIGAKGWRILLVDHNTDLRILLKRKFENLGVSIDDIDHGKLVLGRLEKENYDLTLIEMGLPDVSGGELLKVIRKNSRYDDLPIFLMGEGDKKAQFYQGLSEFKETYFLGKYEGISGIVQSICTYLEGNSE